MELIIKDVDFRIMDANIWDGDPNGKLLLWEEPRRGAEYYLGVDVGFGRGLSNSVIHVLRKGTTVDLDEQVAELACDFLDNHQWAPVVDAVGRMFWNTEWNLPALVVMELNNGGDGTDYDLRTIYQYPNVYQQKVYNKADGFVTTRFGWLTNATTRKKLVTFGVHLLKTKQWKINSKHFCQEMMDFQLQQGLLGMDSELEAMKIPKEARQKRKTRKARDDRLLAGFMAVWGAHDLRDGFTDPAVERKRHQESLQKNDEFYARYGYKRDFQNSDITWEEMQEMNE